MPSDIQHKHLFFRIFPERWHPYVLLARMDRPIGTWLLLLPGLWSLVLARGGLQQIDHQTLFYVALFALGAFLMRSAGCTINDLWDRKLDAQVARTKARPLAAGTLSPRQALAFLGIVLGISFAILLQFNLLTIGLGIVSLLPIVVYPLMKRVTWWPQLFLGLTFNWGALMGWTAQTGQLALPAVLLYLGGLFWTMAYDTIYAHQDTEDDALIGVKSTARLFGAKSPVFVGSFFAFALLAFTAAIWIQNAQPQLMLLPLLHALWQLYRWDRTTPESCLMIFKSNKVFGLLVLLACCL